VTQHFTAKLDREFDRDVATVFSAWLDPEMRRAFETPEGSGMKYAAFDTREGGTEEVIIAPEGQEVGRMISDIHILRRPEIVVVHGRGVFGGVVMMTMQTTFEFTPKGTGCLLTGTSQMVVLGDHPTEDEVRQGWHAMFDRFGVALSSFKTGDST